MAWIVGGKFNRPRLNRVHLIKRGQRGIAAIAILVMLFGACSYSAGATTNALTGVEAEDCNPDSGRGHGLLAGGLMALLFGAMFAAIPSEDFDFSNECLHNGCSAEPGDPVKGRGTKLTVLAIFLGGGGAATIAGIIETRRASRCEEVVSRFYRKSVETKMATLLEEDRVELQLALLSESKVGQVSVLKTREEKSGFEVVTFSYLLAPGLGFKLRGKFDRGQLAGDELLIQLFHQSASKSLSLRSQTMGLVVNGGEQVPVQTVWKQKQRAEWFYESLAGKIAARQLADLAAVSSTFEIVLGSQRYPLSPEGLSRLQQLASYIAERLSEREGAHAPAETPGSSDTDPARH